MRGVPLQLHGPVFAIGWNQRNAVRGDWLATHIEDAGFDCEGLSRDCGGKAAAARHAEAATASTTTAAGRGKRDLRGNSGGEFKFQGKRQRLLELPLLERKFKRDVALAGFSQLAGADLREQIASGLQAFGQSSGDSPGLFLRILIKRLIGFGRDTGKAGFERGGVTSGERGDTSQGDVDAIVERFFLLCRVHPRAVAVIGD